MLQEQSNLRGSTSDSSQMTPSPIPPAHAPHQAKQVYRSSFESDPHRACSFCMQSKIQCQFEPEASSCQHCLRRGLVCTPLIPALGQTASQPNKFGSMGQGSNDSSSKQRTRFVIGSTTVSHPSQPEAMGTDSKPADPAQGDDGPERGATPTPGGQVRLRTPCLRCGNVVERRISDASTGLCQGCHAPGDERAVPPTRKESFGPEKSLLEIPIAIDGNDGLSNTIRRIWAEEEPIPTLQSGLDMTSMIGLDKLVMTSPRKIDRQVCHRCKELEMECLFIIEAKSCQRCLVDDYDCAVPSQKLRRHMGDIAMTEVLLSPDKSDMDSIYRGACIRCKKLKARCEFDASTESCKRCWNGGYKCISRRRKNGHLSDNISQGPRDFSLEEPAVPNMGPLAGNAPGLSQTGSHAKAQFHSSSEVANDAGDHLSENVPWLESSRYIIADEAFSFASDLELPLRVAFADVKFRGQYKIQVGFNEAMLHQGMLAEEIYLLLDGDLQFPESYVCVAFTAAFAPFPALVYTPEKTYFISVDPQGQGARKLQALGRSRATGCDGASSSDTTGVSAGDIANRGGSTGRGGKRTESQGNQDRRTGRGGGGSRESDDDDDDDENTSHRTDGGRKSKEPRPGARIINIPFSSTLSITGIDGSHRVNTISGVDVTINENEQGMSPPADSRWSGPWLQIDMNKLGITSIFIDRPAYLLSLAQVQMTASSSEPVVLLNQYPKHLHTEGDSAKSTANQSKTLNLGTVLGTSPTVQAGYSVSGASGTEKTMRRWNVSSHEIMEADETSESGGALWKYTHNDAIFGRVEGWSFDHDLRPSAVFGISEVKPEVEVQITVFWSSESNTEAKPRDSFPFRWRRAKEQKSVFSNFIYQVAAVIDLEKVQNERSWLMPRKKADSVKRKDLSVSEGPIHFEPVTALAKTHQVTETVSTDCEISTMTAVEERAKLTAAERTGAIPLVLRTPSERVSGHLSLPTPSPSPPPGLRGNMTVC